MEEDGSDNMVCDSESLISNHSHVVKKTEAVNVPVFVMCKCATLIIYLFFATFIESTPCLSAFLILTSAFVEFWLVKNREGLELVGLRWSHEISDRGEPEWIFYSRKDPYIPEINNSRLFWSGTYISCLLWAFIGLISLAKTNIFYSLIAVIVFVLEVINTVCFMKCDKVSAKQVEDIARSVMLGDVFDSDELEPEPEPEEIQPVQQEENEVEEAPRLVLPVQPKRANTSPAFQENINNIEEEIE